MQDQPKLKNQIFLTVLFLLTACSAKVETWSTPVVPNLTEGPVVNQNIVPLGQQKLLDGPSHSKINIANFNPKGVDDQNAYYVEVEGALSPESFARVKAAGGIASLEAVMGESFAKLKKIGALEIDQNAEIGYFTFWLPYDRNIFSKLKEVSLPAEVFINPLSYDLTSLKQIKDFTPASEGFTPRAGTAGFSGLSMMHAPEFVKLAESTIPGVKVDGSSVKLGITDTGITLRHPNFMDAKGASRIIYLKDFTREGRMYFNPDAKFNAKLTDEKINAFTVTAEYLETKVLPTLPEPTTFKTLSDQKMVVSDELKAILTNPSQYKVTLSLLREEAMQGETEAVDINANGSVTDELPALLVIDLKSKGIKVYTDFTGRYDFSNSVGLRDFNLSHDSVHVFAESIGFNLLSDVLIKVDGKTPVRLFSASIVGYDPGNHGSHVAGIAAGRKTIANDPDDTLARGVAPNAQILVNRVCSNNGGCNATRAIIDMVQTGKAEVINMSLGGLSPFNDGYGAQETIVNRLSSLYNTVFMISAGNSGPGRQTVGSPSVAKLSLSIGAAASRTMIERQYQYPGTSAFNSASPEQDEFMLFFSSRGPTAAGGFKPNVSAPGTELSSVQLNASPGGRAGLDVYWGTSMAAPAASGAYALLLDGIKKFNLANPTKPITTDAMKIRDVIIQSARPFAKDQYTWMDEGTGMIDLVATWNALLVMRAETISSGVTDAKGQSLELEYDVITSFKNPTGQAYNGSRVTLDDAQAKIPAFGAGVYLNPMDSSKFFAVAIGRHLNELIAGSPEAGDLTVQLVTTAEEFVLKTDFGKDEAWLKAGVQSEFNCENSVTANLRVIGRGAMIVRKKDGTGELNSFAASTLNLCVDRAKLAALGAGDHGALVSGYRVSGSNVASIASFVVPVSISIPHQSLANSTAYEINEKVKSFQVSRHYVVIPAGTKVARVTLEVPEIKARGTCSGVELMDLEGGNTLKGKETRAQMRISNCNSNGAPEPDPKKRVLILNRTNPKSGMWELHVFGSYNFKESYFKLRVDYLLADTSVKSIKGGLDALSGILTWKLKEASMATQPDPVQSIYEINSLSRDQFDTIKKDEKLILDGPLGKARVYPAGVKKVVVLTGGSPGNDIDLDILECTQEKEPSCKVVASSGGPTADEMAAFEPKDKMAYAIRITGFDIKDAGKFESMEILMFDEVTAGALKVEEKGVGTYDILYSFTPEQIASSNILNQELFKKGLYNASGVLTLKTNDKVTVGAVDVNIAHPVTTTP